MKILIDVILVFIKSKVYSNLWERQLSLNISFKQRGKTFAQGLKANNRNRKCISISLHFI